MSNQREKDGRFAKGNTISLGNSGGRPLRYETQDDLLEPIKEYFEWADKTPWIKNDVVKSGEMAGTPLQIPTQRPYTLIAMCHHIGLSFSVWDSYTKKPEFSEVTTYVRERIQNQQVEGAMVGVFNPNLTARINGIAENTKNDHTTNGKDIGAVNYEKLSNEALEEIVNATNEQNDSTED